MRNRGIPDREILTKRSHSRLSFGDDLHATRLAVPASPAQQNNLGRFHRVELPIVQFDRFASPDDPEENIFRAGAQR